MVDLNQSYIDEEELKRLQDQVATNNEAVGYIDAFNTIGTSLAGKQADMGADKFREQNAQMVKDYLLKKQAARQNVEQQQKDMQFTQDQTRFKQQQDDYSQQQQDRQGFRDPNAPLAKQARNILRQLGQPVDDSVSLYDIKAAGIDPFALFQDQTKANRAISQAMAESKAKAESQALNDEQAIAKEYRSHPVTKASDEVSTSFEKVKKAAKDNSAAGDLSLIFGYMRMLDPGSTVREGEFATAQNAAGIPTQVLNYYNKAVSGERLDPSQRADFLNQANNIYGAQMQRQDEIRNQYRDTVTRYGLNPDRAFGVEKPVEQQTQQVQQKPAVNQKEQPKPSSLQDLSDEELLNLHSKVTTRR
jgi:hypothetical protein